MDIASTAATAGKQEKARIMVANPHAIAFTKTPMIAGILHGPQISLPAPGVFFKPASGPGVANLIAPVRRRQSRRYSGKMNDK